MTEVMIRKSVPLTGREADLIQRAREAGTPQHDALVRLVGGDIGGSEAATLRALLTIGLHALTEELALDDYERLAASRDAEDDQFETTMRRRVRDR